MNYLFPIPCNYSEIVNDDYSKISIDLSTRKAIKDWVKDKLADTDINTNDKQKDVTTLAITLINSIAIAFLPKFIVLGCIVISAIAYVALARMVETKSGTLKNTLIAQRIIEYLVDPNQKGQTLAEDLQKIERELNDLEEAPLRSKKLFGEDLRPSRTQTLKDAAVKKKVDLENQLESLKSDLLFSKKILVLLRT
ncbi:MAG: hypothetical protein C5B45_03250 [Chlamydiae bacterium]|nr:MAG: hypothetical protein C5B45_03250 [Chlamydiota bacterium]